MYVNQPWTIRQYAGFSTAEESNAFYRRNLAAGQKGLSVAFDLATHRGYDSDHPRVAGDVGMAGVAIDSILDMRQLFDGIPLDRMSVSMTMNGAVLPIMALYIVAAEEQGVAPEQLAGTIQNDILKEFMVRNTYIYPPGPSMRIISDIFRYTSAQMPKFNSISISGYHMQEAGATADLELAYTLADGVEYVRAGIEAGLDVDAFAPRLSLLLGDRHELLHGGGQAAGGTLVVGAAHAAVRSRRTPSRCRCAPTRQTSGWSLTAQDVFNNVTRTCVEAMAATQGHTQSLHTNSLDEALALPTDFSARIARNTQLFLQQESGTCRVIDPWGGSYYVERLTHDLAARPGSTSPRSRSPAAWPRPSRPGFPRCGSRRPRPVPRPGSTAGRQTVLGVNKFPPDFEEDIPVLKVDNAEVRAAQLAKLERLRAERDEAACTEALRALTAGAAGDGNLLELAVDAARAQATVGEITDALEKVFGRHTAEVRSIPGVYASEVGRDDEQVDAIRARVEPVRRARGPPAPHPDRQDGPGRPRPGPEGHRHGVRRPGVRRRHRPAVPDAGRGGPSGGRGRRAHRGRQLAGRRPPHPGARAEGGARSRGSRRHHDRRRRRDPAAGLRRTPRRRRRGHLPARHRDRIGAPASCSTNSRT